MDLFYSSVLAKTPEQINNMSHATLFTVLDGFILLWPFEGETPKHQKKGQTMIGFITL
jgi:hypothetical protein